jgi:lipopolysaccharide transport system ATP-binding protein
MSAPVIKVEGLGKQYVIGGRNVDDTLRDMFASVLTSPLRRFRKLSGAVESEERFWALKDVSFDINESEVVGVIGRNGAGKSTLLKILSRITQPTEGRIRIRGRVASLLEVGTGFHQELTGRENVYLNGAILGMSRTDIKRKFDEIVAFSEIEKFLDTPVKRYSSGMYLRLAFGIAAHLEPEILIVDEVLAVGDIEFQRKCVGKMGDVARGGRTVLFVSHNLTAVRNLCTRGMLLEEGTVTFQGPINTTIDTYLKGLTNKDVSSRHRAGSGFVTATHIELRDRKGEIVTAMESGGYLQIHIGFEKNVNEPLSRVRTSVALKTEMDEPVFLQHNRLAGTRFGPLPKKGFFVLEISELPVPAGRYRMNISIMRDDKYLDRIENAAELLVTGGDFFGSGEIPSISHGLCLVRGQWSLRSEEASIPSADKRRSAARA